MRNLFSTLALVSVLCSGGAAFAQEEQSLQTEDGAVLNSRIEEVAALPIVPAEGEDVIAFGAPSPAQDMGLSDEQLEKMHALKNNFRENAGKKVVELKSLQRQMRDLLLQDKVDRAKAADLQGRINAIKNDLSSARLAMKLDSFDILTSEQKQKLRHKALQREAFGGGHKHGGKRMMLNRKASISQAQI